ncbi:MAG: hypothetical protein M1818_003575 [Claussenomyces sp. TS43310]|nr:MAG: hypothetical protein M1818_003575 [Claussenomyces sp. TS43310]
MATIASLQRLPASKLSALLLSQPQDQESRVAIIDVRDDDHIGGHIRGSTHVPSRTLDHAIPTLVRKLANKETVVFHCALSQQRGPAAALRYIRERERLLGPARQPSSIADAMLKSAAERKTEATEGEWEYLDAEGKVEGKGETEQKVYILERGFQGWQEVYGEDPRLTEAYSKELWLDYDY